MTGHLQGASDMNYRTPLHARAGKAMMALRDQTCSGTAPDPAMRKGLGALRESAERQGRSEPHASNAEGSAMPLRPAAGP